MDINVIGVTKTNLMDVLLDPSVYVIKKDTFYGDGRYTMQHIKKVDVEDILNTDNVIIRIDE